MNIRSQVEKIFSTGQVTQRPTDLNQEMINVSPATQRIAHAYERFRNTLEPDEEDILRRRAIVRILERRLIEDKPGSVIAEQLLQELIRANYISPVPKSFARHLGQQQIQRGRSVLAALDHDPKLVHWFRHILAVMIDRELFPRRQEEQLVQLMYHDTFHRTEWIGDLVKPQQRATQLYMACHRSLFESDDYEIAYHYFLNKYPDWNNQDISDSDLKQVASNLPEFYTQLDKSLHHPARDRIMRLLRPAAVPYRILKDLTPEPGEDLSELEDLEQSIRSAISSRARKLKFRMSKRAWSSILFLLFTKVIIALVIEVPYESIFLNEIHWPALAINVIFHPILLFLAATSVRLPGHQNTEIIIEQVKAIVQGQTPLPTLILRPARSYGAVTWSFFALIYAVLFLLIFWGMFSVLAFFKFSLVAMFLFVMFLGLVSFLSIRVRRSINEIKVVQHREGVFGTLLTFLSLPILEFGRWLAQNIRQLNVLLFLMDRVLESPFKLLIDVTEEWFTFVSDRREEIV